MLASVWSATTLVFPFLGFGFFLAMGIVYGILILIARIISAQFGSDPHLFDGNQPCLRSIRYIITRAWIAGIQTHR